MSLVTLLDVQPIIGATAIPAAIAELVLINCRRFCVDFCASAIIFHLLGLKIKKPNKDHEKGAKNQ